MPTLTELHATGVLGTHERWEIPEDGSYVRITTVQDCDPVIDAVAAARDLPKGKEDGLRYVGSIPLVLADIWAKECGAYPGTKEFGEYAKRKLQDIDNRKLLVNRF